MTKAYILILPTHRRGVFNYHIEEYGNFAEPVPVFSHNRNYPYLVLLVAEESHITHLGSGKGGLTAGSGMKRMNIERIITLNNPISFRNILTRCSKKLAKPIEKSFLQGGPIPTESYKEIIRCLIDIDPSIEQQLESYIAKNHSLRKLSSKTLESLSDQKEAISTALQLTDLDRSPLQSWDVGNNERPLNFLDGLGQVYLREDQMINSDLTVLPGFDIVKTTNYTRAQFKSRDSDVLLDVIVANRTLMEEQTGADLIYYNESYRSFVLVQYKAMEKETGVGAVFRLPNAQLKKQIADMEALSQYLGDTNVSHHSHYRLTYNPFFIKLCPRVVFDPNEMKLTPGMYFNLDHWRILELDEELSGSDGGRVITFQNVGRHISNTDFSVLVKHSWIGTTPIQSKILEKLITEILASGKSLVYAVKRDTKVHNKHSRRYTENDMNDEDIPF